MKLLRKFFRWRLAGFRRVLGPDAVVPRAFSVTVPAPLVVPVMGAPTVVAHASLDQANTEGMRREPASFLKAPRHLRLGSGR